MKLQPLFQNFWIHNSNERFGNPAEFFSNTVARIRISACLLNFLVKVTWWLLCLSQTTHTGTGNNGQIREKIFYVVGLRGYSENNTDYKNCFFKLEQAAQQTECLKIDMKNGLKTEFCSTCGGD